MQHKIPWIDLAIFKPKMFFRNIEILGPSGPFGTWTDQSESR